MLKRQKTDNFDQQTTCEAPVCGQKYTTSYLGRTTKITPEILGQM